MLMQNDFNAPHTRASADEGRTEQLVSTHAKTSRIGSRDRRNAPTRRLGNASRIGLAGVAAAALIGGFVTPAHAEELSSPLPDSSLEAPERPTTTDSGTASTPPGSTGTSGSTGTTGSSTTGGSTSPAPTGGSTPLTPAEAERLEAAQVAAAKRAAAKKAAAKKAKAKKAAAKKKAAKKRALLKKRKAAVTKKRAKIARAASRQIGDFQDCTRVAERALRSVGIRGGDLGTQVKDYTSLGGRRVSVKHKRAGDILIWPGRHVAVYTGKGKAVHGGWGGFQTVKNHELAVYGNPVVVRYFKVKRP